MQPLAPDPGGSGSRSNALLGYPDDARLLMVNADDLGLCESVNRGVMAASGAAVVRSTSLMVPWPAAAAAIRMLREAPDLDLGVHLWVVCEMPGLRVAPVAPVDAVRSLVDASGVFHAMEHADTFLERAREGEVEVEFRAQIEVVLAEGLTRAGLATGGRRKATGWRAGLATGGGRPATGWRAGLAP